MQTTTFFYLIVFLKLQTKQKIQTKKKLTQDVLFLRQYGHFYLKICVCVCCRILTKTLIGVTDVSCGGFWVLFDLLF